MANELAKISGTMAVQSVKQGVAMMQKLLKDVLKLDVHYGAVPGCGDKRVLLKPGAEKILAMFGVATRIKTEEYQTLDGGARFRVTVECYKNGEFIGEGIGECSTSEEKFAWRTSRNKQEFEATDADKKRIKWIRSKGNDVSLEQVRENPEDKRNTVLKMAKKRALVDACLTATGASDIFAQDLDEEDLDGGFAPVRMPEATPAPEPDKRQVVNKAEAVDANATGGEGGSDAGDGPEVLALLDANDGAAFDTMLGVVASVAMAKTKNGSIKRDLLFRVTGGEITVSTFDLTGADALQTNTLVRMTGVKAKSYGTKTYYSCELVSQA